LAAMRFIIFLFFISILSTASSQHINANLLKQPWSAFWVEVPGAPAKDYGIYYFRKSFVLDARPPSFIVHVSGDNRYKLFVNGTLVSLGPARSDLYYWNYETVDLAPYLMKGKNTIASVVWNDGDLRPEAQISNRSGFLLQGDSEKESVANTNDSWRCLRNNAYHPLTGLGYGAYYVTGPGELINMNESPQNWMGSDFDDNQWSPAKKIGWHGAWPKGAGDINGWMLVPSSLPQMEMKKQRFQALRSTIGIAAPAGFPAIQTAFSIPPHTKAVLLIDQSFLTDAYPVLIFSKGKNAGISISYAEALYEHLPQEDKPMTKGNRNEVDGKFFIGKKDSLISNGNDNQEFISLAWRTFRYVQLTINTAEEPMTVDDFYNIFTGYPFQFNASFNTDDSALTKILEIGWRTARSCAWETYMDCPYYEQLQYIGDSRIQALVSLYNSGDDRLARNALNEMDHSRIAEGITLSRHPSFSPQQIPTFSLWYIGMLHDYWMYRGDSSFIADKMQGVRDILWFFSKYQQKDGTLKNTPYWMFTDWVDGHKGWDGGTAPYGKEGSSSILDLQLLWAYQVAADLETKFGLAAQAAAYKSKAVQLQNSIKKNYWDN
ncbi:MAG: alpha-rhamnosidase, partial [Bacteroidetes bacterium]|nr:alpha-rhamnosidase [Bacteroidota bacterium]